MFCVYESGKPASEVGYPKLDGLGWTSHRFETLVEATEYANKWLGPWAGQVLPVGVPVEYSGYGGTIEIREEP